MEPHYPYMPPEKYVKNITKKEMTKIKTYRIPISMIKKRWEIFEKTTEQYIEGEHLVIKVVEGGV